MAQQKKIQSSGIGESRLNRDENAPAPAILDCHVNGVRVGDLPEITQQGITYAITDEGLEERMERIAKAKADGWTDEMLRVKVGDQFDSQKAAFKAFRKDHPGAPVNFQHDPMHDAVEAHREDGMTYKFLSPRINEKKGLRGYEVVKDRKNDPVKVQGMVLGKIPQAIADERKAKSRARTDYLEKLVATNERELARGGDARPVVRPPEPLQEMGESSDIQPVER